MILVSAQGPNPSFFFFWGTFIQLGGLLGQGLGPGLGPGLDNILLKSAQNKTTHYIFLHIRSTQELNTIKIPSSSRSSSEFYHNFVLNKLRRILKTGCADLSMHILGLSWPPLTRFSPAPGPALWLRSSQKQEPQSTILRPRLVLAKHPVYTFKYQDNERMVSL